MVRGRWDFHYFFPPQKKWLLSNKWSRNQGGIRKNLKNKYYHEFRTGLILGWWLQGRQWYTAVNVKLNAAQERQTQSRTSTTGTNTTSRSIQSVKQDKRVKRRNTKRDRTSPKKLSKPSALNTEILGSDVTGKKEELF